MLEGHVGGAQIAAKVAEQYQQCGRIGDQVNAEAFFFVQCFLHFLGEGERQCVQTRSRCQARRLRGKLDFQRFVFRQQQTCVVGLFGLDAGFGFGSRLGVFGYLRLPGSLRLGVGICLRYGEPCRFLGIEADVVDSAGNSLPANAGGFAVIKKPWPSMMRTIYKDPERYKTYWNTIPNCYTAGDVCHKDADGYMWFMGRADDVIKVAGNRLGTAEVESALVSHHAVAEAAVIGKPHKTVGESIKAFIILKQGETESPALIQSIKDQVMKELGKIGVPSEIDIVQSLPKTRSGKIMRRVLKAKELGQDPGDISTIEE